jgi:hypothetical protein
MADNRELEVGYKNPPKATQFQKGRSGNLSGRRRADPSIPAVFRRVAKQTVRTNGQNGAHRMTKLEASITQLMNKAATGDLRATKVLMQMASRFPELVKDPESIKVTVEVVDPQASPGANPIAEQS